MRDVTDRELMELWETCFGDSKEYMDYYVAWKCKRNRVLTSVREGKLVSMLHLNPYEVSVFGSREETGYVVGVATDPDYRHHGLMRDLLARAAREEDERGRSWMFLMPADPAIYLPFDYRFFYIQERLELPVNAVCREEDPLDWQGWGEMSPEQRAEGLRFADAFLRKEADVYAVRSEAYYEDLQAERKAGGGDLLFGFRGEEAVCCLSYFREEGELSVTELLAAERGLADVKITALARGMKKAEVFDARWTDLPGKRREKPIMMGRILDPEAFVGKLRGAEPAAAECVLRDPFLPHRDGGYRILLGAECHAERIPAREDLPVWTPGDLAAWIFAHVPMRTVLNEIV